MAQVIKVTLRLQEALTIQVVVVEAVVSQADVRVTMIAPVIIISRRSILVVMEPKVKDKDKARAKGKVEVHSNAPPKLLLPHLLLLNKIRMCEDRVWSLKK